MRPLKISRTIDPKNESGEIPFLRHIFHAKNVVKNLQTGISPKYDALFKMSWVRCKCLKDNEHLNIFSD
jgi:hypothetical protein